MSLEREPRIQLDPTLAPYLRVHAPGRATTATESVETERRPEALTQTRTRPLPVDWDLLLASSRLGAATEIEVFRQEFEASWAVDADPAELMKRYLVQPTNLVAAFRDGSKPMPRTTELPASAVVLGHGRGSGLLYWLVAADQELPVTEADFANYEAGWQRVDRVVTVFPRDAIILRPSLSLDKAAGAVHPAQGSVAEMSRLPLPVDLPTFARPTFGIELPLPDLRPRLPLAPLSDVYPTAEARARLERSWTAEATAEVLKAVITQAGNVGYQYLDGLDGQALHRAVVGDSQETLTALEATKLMPVPEDAWLLHLRDRSYWAKPGPGKTLGNFDTPDGYYKAWTNIASLELVKAPDREAPFSHQFLCPMHLELIVAQFESIDAEEPMAAGFAELGDKLKDRLGDAVRIEDVSDAEIERLTQRYRTLKLRARELAEAKRSLQRQAAQLGYHLAITNGPLPDGRTQGAKGRLYRSTYYWAYYSRLEPYTVEIVRRVAFFRFKIRVVRYRTRIVQRRLQTFEEVLPGRAQWEIAQERLAQSGFIPVFLELGSAGYASADGLRLEDLMQQLEQDEALRQRIALFVPLYQQKLTLGLVKTEYLVVLRPLPGMMPIALPGAYLEESTSYRLSWRGVEVGELLTSVPLAPGESRRIEISQQFQRKVERVQSVTTALDVSASQTWELSDAIEQTSRRESESGSSSNWNAQASGSFFGISAGGGGGGTRSSSVRELAETVRKTASKAARELRQSFRQEVKTSTTDSVTLSSEERTASTVTNINQGATLNIFFYRTQNVFEGGLYLEQGRLLLQRSIEMVAGTGIRDYLSFSFAEIAEFIDALLRDPLFAKHVDLQQPWVARRVLLRATIQPLLAEYVDLAPSTKAFELLNEQERDRLMQRASRGQATVAMRFAEVLERAELDYLVNGNIVLDPEPDDGAPGRAIYLRELALCSSLLRKLELTNLPIDRHPLVAPSRAIYADACLGQQPATEPYSEWMRAAEVNTREANIAVLRARARSIDRTIDHARGVQLAHPRILRIQPGVNDGDWIIELDAPLPGGSWQLVADSMPSVVLDSAAAGKTSVPVRLPAEPLPGQIRLENLAQGLMIGF